MKHIADRGYTDVVLNRHVDKDAILEEEYAKDNKELTEERINYLVNERNLYIPVEEEETPDDKQETTEEETKKNTTKSKTKNTKKDNEK